MMSKPDKPKPLEMPKSALDAKPIKPPDDVARTYSSLISTSPMGLDRKADVKKKSLLGGT